MWKIAKYAGLAAGVIVIACIVIFYFFQEDYINRYFKYRIIKEFTTLYPGYSIGISDLHFNKMKNRFELGSVVINSDDSSFSCSIDKPSLSGINWFRVILKGDLVPDVLANSVADAQKIVVKLRKSQYEFRCGKLHISLHDGEIAVDGLELQPTVGDNRFFEESKFSRTRFRMVLPQLKISGLKSSQTPQGNKYHARFIQIPDVSLDILVNKSKPIEQEASKTNIRNDIFTTLKDIFQADSLSILKGRIIYGESFAGSDMTASSSNSYSGYLSSFTDLSFNILVNRIKIGAMVLYSADSSFSCRMNNSSLEGIGWLKLIGKDGFVPEACSGSIVEAQKIVLSMKNSQYKYNCGMLRFSLRDSEIVAKNIDVQPLVDDNQFFDDSKFRKTRFRLVIPQLKVRGLASLGLLQGKAYRAPYIQIRDASLDVLVSMYKASKRGTSKPLMPNELLTSIKKIISVDSLSIINGRIKYCESYSARSKPAVITFDNLHLLAEGISNNDNNGDTVVIRGNALFMKAGTMKAILHIPLTSPKFSLRYSGSIGSMEMSKLNSFLEISEHKRIQSGTVQSASFDIQVKNGHAKGSVRAVYNDFKLALLDSKTGSEKGIMNRIKSFYANTFILQSKNRKDSTGLLKSGIVKYSRKHDDTFLQYAWFALRSGVGDVIGF